MIKKIVSISVCIALLLNAFAVFAADSAERRAPDVYSEAVRLLDYFGIIPDTADTDGSSQVSRAEFALYLGRIHRADEYSDAKNRYFRDVSPQHWAASSLELLVEKGIVAVSDSRNFRPDDVITFSEAEKMILCAMGYSAYAEALGGYPTGYDAVAKKIDLISGANRPANVTVDTARMLLHKALITGIFDDSAVNGDSVVLSQSDDVTLLSQYFDCYLAEGQLTSADGVSINYDESAADDRVCIGGESYFADDSHNALAYLGQYVRAFYIKPDKNSVGEICIIDRSYNKYDNVKVISDEDFKSFGSDMKINYYTGDNSEKSIRVAANAVILRNGELVTKNMSAEFSDFSGTVTAIDTDSNSIYDVVVIDSYVNGVVKSVSEKDSVICFEGGSISKIDISSNHPAQKKVIRSSNGDVMSISDIAAGDVLSIFDSKTLLRISDTKTAVTGVLENVYDNSSEVKIDGKRYSLDTKLVSTADAKLIAGSECSAKFDIFGKIAEIKKSAQSAPKVGYLVDRADGKRLSDDVILKVFSSSGTMDEYTLESKVRVNGEKVDASDIAGYLKKDYGGDKSDYLHQLICYKTSSAGKISEIDTDYLNVGKEGEDTLRKDVESGSYVYASSPKMFGPKCIIDSKTVIMGVPASDAEDGATDDDYAIMSTANFKSGTAYTVESYKTEKDTFYSNVVLFRGSVSKAITSETDFALVESIGRTSSDGTECEYVTCAINGAKKDIIVDSKYSLVADGVEEGDVVRFGYTKDDMINSAEIMYDYSEKELNKHRLLYATFFNTIRFTFGTITERRENIVKMSFGTLGDFDELQDLTGIPVMVYDSSRRDDKVYIGKADDIRDFEIYGSDASAFYARTENGKVTKFVLYK